MLAGVLRNIRGQRFRCRYSRSFPNLRRLFLQHLPGHRKRFVIHTWLWHTPFTRPFASECDGMFVQFCGKAVAMQRASWRERRAVLAIATR